MEVTGYPSFILYLILLIGLPLALLRPFKALLLIVFLLSSANSAVFTLTRTSYLGPYFNANDACLLIALIAVSPYVIFQIKKIQFPEVAIWIIVVLLVGFIQSWFVLGWTYEVLRALRWAISLPLYLIIAATMVDCDSKVKYLLLALFLGSIVSAAEHIIFVNSTIEGYQFSINNVGEFRTIAYRSPGVWFLLASLVWMPKFKGLNRVIMLTTGALFAISVLLNQTRSIWIASIAVLPISLMLFKKNKKNRGAVLIPIVLVMIIAAFMLMLSYINKDINAVNIIAERLETFSDLDVRYLTTITRLSALYREIEEWGKGTLILGRGLAYFIPLYVPNDFIAWGHLGHVTTLAQLGLIGLLIYSLYLPFTIVKAARTLWHHTSDDIKYFGLLSGITMISSWICFLMSDSFLGQHAIEGIIFGAAWRQAGLMRMDKAYKTNSNFKVMHSCINVNK